MIQLSLYTLSVPLKPETFFAHDLDRQMMLLAGAVHKLASACQHVKRDHAKPDDVIRVSYEHDSPLYGVAQTELEVTLFDLLLCDSMGLKLLGMVIVCHADVRVQLRMREGGTIHRTPPLAGDRDLDVEFRGVLTTGCHRFEMPEWERVTARGAFLRGLFSHDRYGQWDANRFMGEWRYIGRQP